MPAMLVADSAWPMLALSEAMAQNCLSVVCRENACVIAAILLLLNGYLGYFGVFLAVGAAAAVNLR